MQLATHQIVVTDILDAGLHVLGAKPFREAASARCPACWRPDGWRAEHDAGWIDRSCATVRRFC